MRMGTGRTGGGASLSGECGFCAARTWRTHGGAQTLSEPIVTGAEGRAAYAPPAALSREPDPETAGDCDYLLIPVYYSANIYI